MEESVKNESKGGKKNRERVEISRDVEKKEKRKQEKSNRREEVF